MLPKMSIVIYHFLQENKLLFKDQFGFRSKMSKSSALLLVTDSLFKSMDEGNVSGAVYLDLKKSLLYGVPYSVPFEVDRVWSF